MQISSMAPGYYEWFSQQTFPKVKSCDVHDRIMKELTMFRNMTTEEYILWQKYQEVNEAYPMHKSTLYGEPAYCDSNDARLITQVKSMLYNGDALDVEPELIWTGDEKHEEIRDHWTALRILIHSQQHSGAIGRGINYLVRDRSTKQYLGVVAIASDFLDLSARDNEIGWTREQRTQEKRINYTAVCSTIVPVQPFGYNYTGGKLLALLCLSDVVQAKWKELYGSTLVGLTTTSLYGKAKGGHGMSQYDNLSYWKKMGYSVGSSAFRLSSETRDLAFQWAKSYLPQDYYAFVCEGMTLRDKLNRFMQKIYRGLNISARVSTSNHDRGIYFAPLYENTNAFLRVEIPESDLNLIPGLSVEDLYKLWSVKYANKRWNSLANRDQLSSQVLFYDDLSYLSWEEAKSKYLQDVGR